MQTCPPEPPPIVTNEQNHQMPGEFEIGIAEIDLQHRQLYRLLERLKASADKQYGYAAAAILAELEIETRVHFAVEESLMRLLAYPDTEAHVAEHHRLTEHLKKLKERAQDFDVEGGLATFIQTWLIDHVDGFDRKFVAHFLQKGIDPHAAPRQE